MAVKQINKDVELVPKLIFEYEFPEILDEYTSYPVRDTRYGFTLDWNVSCEFPRIFIELESCTEKGTNGKVKSYKVTSTKDLLVQYTWNEKNKFPLEFVIDEQYESFAGYTIFVSIEIVLDTHTDLKKNLAALIDVNEDNWSDVTFIFGDQKLKAHKAILAARSPVFARMFKTDMLEKDGNIIEIHDDDPQAFKEMLGAIYSGPCQHYVADNAKALILLADKYQIDDLKDETARILNHSLNIDNAVDLLIFADQYNFEDLKLSAIQFFGENKNKILHEGTRYKQIFDSKYFHLIDKLFHTML